jgi:DNA-binding transcriptional LysR family regulator
LADLIEPIVMPPVLRLIAAQAPGVSIESCLLVSADFSAQLRDGSIDLACYSYPFNAPDTITLPICAVDTVVIGRRGHPDIGKSLDLATYARLGHVALVPELRAMLHIDKDLAAQQVPRRIVCLVNKVGSIAPLVERTDLIGQLTRWFAAEIAHNYNIDVHPLPLKISEQYVYMIWHCRSPARHEPAGGLERPGPVARADGRSAVRAHRPRRPPDRQGAPPDRSGARGAQPDPGSIGWRPTNRARVL